MRTVKDIRRIRTSCPIQIKILLAILFHNHWCVVCFSLLVSLLSFDSLINYQKTPTKTKRTIKPSSWNYHQHSFRRCFLQQVRQRCAFLWIVYAINCLPIKISSFLCCRRDDLNLAIHSLIQFPKYAFYVSDDSFSYLIPFSSSYSSWFF